MAIDSHTKRRSATGIQTILTIPPVPDGTISAVDREHVAYIYGGISAGTTGVSGVASWTKAVFRGVDAITGQYVYIIGQRGDIT